MAITVNIDHILIFKSQFYSFLFNKWLWNRHFNLHRFLYLGTSLWLYSKCRKTALNRALYWHQAVETLRRFGRWNPRRLWQKLIIANWLLKIDWSYLKYIIFRSWKVVNKNFTPFEITGISFLCKQKP